jgi:hypothetical protein
MARSRLSRDDGELRGQRALAVVVSPPRRARTSRHSHRGFTLRSRDSLIRSAQRRKRSASQVEEDRENALARRDARGNILRPR